MKNNLTKLSMILLSGLLASTTLFGCSNATPMNSENTSDTVVDVTPTPDTNSQDEVIVDVSIVTPTPTPELSLEPTPEPTPDYTINTNNDPDDGLTSTQRNSINMLNYITVLTQQINDSKNSRLYLEAAQSSLLNNIYPNAVDTKTQSQINNLWNTIDGYRMIEAKRSRLEYIYEQNKAQALREAIPNPVGLLSAVQSGSVLKAAASVLYMAIDAKASYDRASTQADLKYLQDGWELEDSESEELSRSQLNLLNYMLNMVRDNDFPGEYSLTVDSVKEFVKWTNKSNLVSKITWLKSNEETYQYFPTYWIELARCYFDDEDFDECLNAFKKYEEVVTRIFRKDYDYAESLPMAIIAANEAYSVEEYIKFADKYTATILDNCEEKNWELRYFVAQIYIDLFAKTNNIEYLNAAFTIAFENVNLLVSEQVALNENYFAPVTKLSTKNLTSREKKEVEEYNKLITEQRKVELPPVSEALYLNCDLLFALLEKVDVPESTLDDIDAILHENDAKLFLTDALDNKYWANKQVAQINNNSIEIEFTGDKIIIPASCMTERSYVKVSISNGDILDDWIVVEVERPKNSNDCSEYKVHMTSKSAKEHKYSAGETITIDVITVSDNQNEKVSFSYAVVEKNTLGFIKGVSIERILK